MTAPSAPPPRVPRRPHGLPERRPGETWRIDWRGRAFQVRVGFDWAGRAREVFVVSDWKDGSDFRAVLDDACVAVSCLLQYEDAAAVAHHLASAGDVALAPRFALAEPAPEAPPASLLGAVVRAVLAIERAAGPGVRSLHAGRETAP